jgi:hypothetical protein
MSEEEEDKVVVHVRFAPNGDVVEIGERVQGKNPQDWFNFLSERFGGEHYLGLFGGRGVFRLTKEQLEQAKAAAVPAPAS